MMASKRISHLDSSLQSKKIKQECYFPLGVRSIIIEIGRYLEGDYLKNYKLACKQIEESMHDIKPEPIQITLKGFQRTTTTPGSHIIKCDGTESDLIIYINCQGALRYPNIKHLTIDHCRIKRKDFDYQFIFNNFHNLESLRIIRSIDDVNLKITEAEANLSSLEIYTTRLIILYLHKKIDRALLSTTEILEHGFANILIDLPPGNPIDYASGVKCHAEKSIISYNHTGFMIESHPFGSFVPKPEFL